MVDWAAEEEANGRVPAATPDAATAEQIEILRARGHTLPANLTRLEALRLISGPPTEEQLDRLKFYGITLPDGGCQEEVAEIISRQMRENWDSEEAYQAYRRRSVTRQQRSERSSSALKLRQSPPPPPVPASALGLAPIPTAVPDPWRAAPLVGLSSAPPAPHLVVGGSEGPPHRRKESAQP